MHNAAVAGAEYFGGVKWHARPVDKVDAISHLGSARPVCDFPSAGPRPTNPDNLTLVLLCKGAGLVVILTRSRVASWDNR